MREGDYRELLKGPNDFQVHATEEQETEKYADALVKTFSSLEEKEAVRRFPELE
jgi:hypothetical protein